jgi:hypothetical protein
MWKELSPEEKFKRIAWSVATSSAIESRGDVLEIYNRLLEDRGIRNTTISGESNKT